MVRRTALKQLMLVAGGAALLPACVRNLTETTLVLKNLKISGDDESLLAEITEAIIPATETPGAKDLKLHQFVLRMVDDCYEPEQQQKFSAGLAAFSKMAETKTGDSFTELDKQQKDDLLKQLELVRTGGNKEEKEASINTFYSITRDLTVRGYITSEYVLTQQLYYNMIPGRFDGCVEIKEANDYKTILG
jgi:hypothetical protein